MTKAHILPDILGPGLKLVFCGTGASARSAEDVAYYAHPGNLFWPTLHRIGLTPRRFAPHEFNDLAALGIGLTDIVKTASGSDAELPRDAWDTAGLRRKILKFAPALLAFTSKAGARACLDLKRVDYGLMTETLGETRLFVLPSPSGRARSYWYEAPWRALADLANEIGSSNT
jgi:TDG/mug DNA glycosylase family protein